MMKEIRQTNDNLNINDRHITGYALVFDTPSDNLIGWTETIKRGAVTNETIANSIVLAKLNHDDNKVLAKSNKGIGSLTLTVDERGLKYDFDAPNTALGDELLEYLRRGDISTSSFAFSISSEPNSEKWYKQNGIIYRDIMKIDRLYDISPVFIAAYDSTTCTKRFSEIEAQSKEIDIKMNLLKTEIDLM